ncbi:hypothetical protein N9J96_06385 [Paracoccaceae bacterium]|jgi:hypothetical protein|nr:hypothetical protein [Paracoccaceae bacterium]MDB4229865.1 hypothetical protein [Paracoccaceae bacterium]|tara:strand:- start:98 stop:520 length:423 start_codon:yes stop_codon:yes gene_type:complete
MEKIFKQFLGKWSLIKGSCVYEQGAPPVDGHYQITQKTKDLLFQMVWLDNTGERHDFIFKSRPDNLAMPFKGGDLADSLSSTIVSERELNTIAYKNGIKVMEVRRNLSNSYNQMTISQTVFVSEKDKPTNWSSYSKVIIH